MLFSHRYFAKERDLYMMKKYLLTIFCLLLAMASQAQTRKIQHRPYIDQRRFHYGFMIGFHLQDMELKNTGAIDSESGEQWYADVDNYSPGFNVGVLGEMRLNNNFALRVTPTLYFGQKTVRFHEQISGRDSSQNLKDIYLSIPVAVKFTPPRFNNYRPYFLAGVSPTLDLTVKKNRALLVKPFDCYIELGMGCDFYLPYFKLIPELKFCFGLADILQKKRNDLMNKSLLKYTSGLSGASSKMIVLTLYFE